MFDDVRMYSVYSVHTIYMSRSRVVACLALISQRGYVVIIFDDKL